MAEENPFLSIDSDWKRQAQEEKRRLAEEQQKREAAAASAPVPMTTGPGAAGIVPAVGGARAPEAATQRGTGRGRRELPPASFANLVQSIVTQVFFYLGDLSPQGGEPMLNLDMAKHQLDTLGMLEDKTRGNLTPEEQHLFDTSIYEARMRFVSVASQFI